MDNNQIQFMESIYMKKIQKWWRKHTAIKALSLVHKYLFDNLSKEYLQELSNKCNAIIQKCKGDGAGLSSGTLIDMLLCEAFQTRLSEYCDYHDGESDMKICNIPLSQKKINGKSTIALDWSKNKNKSQREHFSCHILIINLKTEQWWKKTPVNSISNINITYNDKIPSGIYIIDKQFCKYSIKLSSNNKTDTLIDSQYLYIMLKHSINQKLFIALPSPNKQLKFNILNAFSE
jgi:hypothetical protein